MSYPAEDDACVPPFRCGLFNNLETIRSNHTTNRSVAFGGIQSGYSTGLRGGDCDDEDEEACGAGTDEDDEEDEDGGEDEEDEEDEEACGAGTDEDDEEDEDGGEDEEDEEDEDEEGDREGRSNKLL